MKRVFILATQSMFSQGVACLLRQETAFEIVGQQTELHQAIACIQKLQPDVVILDTHSRFNDPTAVLLVLTALPNIKVIGLSLRRNTFQIYRANQREATSMADLVNAIEDEA
jgi:DNA-binding NarL/FixJ family response regulator